MATLTWHGHSCFELATDEGLVLLFDPFLDESPVSDIQRSDLERVDFILCSHGHRDHGMRRTHPAEGRDPHALRDLTVGGSYEF